MFNWFSKKKDKDLMQDNEQFKEGTKFKWIKGDRFGTVCTLKNIKNNFFVFTDGTKCHLSMLNDMIIQSVGDEPVLDEIELLKQGVGINNQPPGNVIHEVAVQPAVVATPTFVLNNNTQSIQINNINPVIAILDKQNIKPSKIELTFEVKIPKDDLIAVLNSSFDNADEEISKWVALQITHDKIFSSLKNSIKKPKYIKQRGPISD